MAAPTEADVIALLGGDWDCMRPESSMSQFLASAGRVVARVVACAASNGYPLTSDETDDLTKWIAAHLYQQSDPGYVSKSTLSASGTFKGEKGTGWRSTNYGSTALMMDPSGCLQRVGGVTVGAFYGGTTPEERLYPTA